MSRTGDKKYDIFVSYASDDNIPVAGDTRYGGGWIVSFVALLQRVLSSQMGGRENISIYFDKRNLSGNHQLEELLLAAKDSALFLAISSTAYNYRPWTKLELEAFLSTGADPRRVFCIEHMPLDDGEIHLLALSPRRRVPFWNRDGVISMAAKPLDPNDPYFLSRIYDLGHDIKKQLKDMGRAQTAQPGLRQAARYIAEEDRTRREAGTGAAKPGNTVYLAETSDDLIEERLQVERYLRQFDVNILPQGQLPGGGEAFLQTIRPLIGSAGLYVQLLGPRPGRKPSDLSEGYVKAQFDIAKELGIPTALWHHPNLDVASIADPVHYDLLTCESVFAGGLQGFIDLVRHRVKDLSAPKPPAPQKKSFVYISAIEDDLAAAQTAKTEFSSVGLSAALPLFEGTREEIVEDLHENIRLCDILVLIFGEAPQSWVRGQMRLFNKLRAGENAPIVAIFVGPPEEKPADIGFSVPGMWRVDFLQGWRTEEMRKFIEDINR